MKKLEFTIVPLLVMLSLSPAAGQSFSLPAASQAHPDVLGIKVGASTFNDVRSIFGGTALALRVKERRTWLQGKLTTGWGIQIPNSEYVEELMGVSKTYHGPDNSPCSETGTNCQELRAWFSAPPNAGTVLNLSRTIQLADGPLTETVIQGLVDKYGQPGFRKRFDNGVALVWAWAPDGSTMALNERHICASQGAAMRFSSDALQAGCAAMLYVFVNQENSITKFETIYLIDHYGFLAADTKTRAFAAEGVATYEKCERDAAAKRSVPSEFMDAPTGTKASPQVADSASSCTPTTVPFSKAGPCDQVCGFITVNITGTPVNVSIDYVRAGLTPLINYKVRPGLHRISLFVGREMVDESVLIDSGATVVKSYGGFAQGAPAQVPPAQVPPAQVPPTQVPPAQVPPAQPQREAAPSSSDISSALLTAKGIVDGASYDTVRARQLRLSGDTANLAVLRAAYANRLDSARTYLAMALASPDTALRINAAAILVRGGTKLAQANIWDHAYPWLDQTLQVVVPRTPSDTTGPRQQIRIQASFWYGLSSVPTLNDQYRAMVNSRSCTEAKTVSERIARTKEALMLGMRVHPPTVNQMLQTLGKFENQMPRVKATFGCDNF